MSTCNYYTTIKGAPLVVYEADDAEEEAIEAEAADAEAVAFSDGLRWYSVEVRGGYYTGVQFDILYTDAGDYARGLAEEGDDETARDWYGMSAAELAADMAREYAEAVRWVRDWIKAGWVELGLAGVFSNGEGVYFQIDPRRVCVTGPDSVAEAVAVAMI